MLNGLVKEFGFPFLHLCPRGPEAPLLPRQAFGVDEEFPRKLSNKNGEVKENDITCQAKVEMSCCYQDRNVLLFRSEILRIFFCENSGS